MTEDLKGILDQIRTEIKSYNELSVMLVQSARDISLDAAPPSEDILAAVASARARFSSLRKKLTRIEGINSDALTSLKAMEQLVDQLLTEEQERSQELRFHQAVPLLDKILQLRNTHSAHQLALEDCKNQARTLKEELSLMEDDGKSRNIAELEQSLAPFQALLTLVELSDQLDDETWLDLNTIVERRFGTPLALAASRKKLLMEALDDDASLSPTCAANLPCLELEERDIVPSSAGNTAGPPATVADKPPRKIRWPAAALITVVLAALTAGYAYETQYTFTLDGYRLRTLGVNIKAINQPLANGDTYLLKTIREKNLPAMQLLLRHGARINDRDGAGNTPLHMAVQINFIEGVQLLANNGADLTLRDAGGKNPGELALSLGNADVASFLLPDGIPHQPRNTSAARNPFAMTH